MSSFQSYRNAAAPVTGEAPFVSGSTSPPIASSIPTVSAASPTTAKPSPTTAKPSHTTAKRSASSSSRRAGASAPKRPRKATTPPLKPPKNPEAKAQPQQPAPVWNCERLEELAGPGPWRTTRTLKSLLTFAFVDKEGAIDAHVDLIERVHQAGLVFHHEELPVRSPLDNSPTPYSDVIISRKPAKKGKIKRPLNSFMVWAKGQRLHVTRARPDINNAAVSKHLGAVWKRLSQDIKLPFKVESKRLKELHEAEYPDYKYAPQKKKSKQDKQAAATVTRTESGRVSKKPVREPSSAAAPDTSKVKAARARKAAGGGGSGRKAKTSAVTTTPNVSAEVNRCLQSMLQSGPQRDFQHLQVPATATTTTTTTTGKSFSRLLIDEDFKKGVRDSEKLPSCSEKKRRTKKPARKPSTAAADTTKVKAARARKAAGGGGSGRKAKTSSAATTTPRVSAEDNRCLQAMLQSGPQRHFEQLQASATTTSGSIVLDKDLDSQEAAPCAEVKAVTAWKAAGGGGSGRKATTSSDATTTPSVNAVVNRCLQSMLQSGPQRHFQQLQASSTATTTSQKAASGAEVIPPAAEGDVGGLCNGLPPLSFPVEDASTMVSSKTTPPSQHNCEGAMDVDVGGFVPAQEAASSSSTGGLQQLTTYTPQQQPPAYQEDAGVPGLAPLDSISDLRDLAVEPLTASWNEDVKFESIGMEHHNSLLDHVDNNGGMIVDFVTDEDVTHVTENVPENMFA